MSRSGKTQVRTRRVFYIPGYDPVPPRRYRELYRREAAKQAAISGYDIDVAGSPGRDTFGWEARARIDTVETAARIDVLVWSDLVQRSMQGGIAATYGHLLRTAWIYLSTGTLWRLTRLRKGPVLAALYPVLMLLAQLALAVGLGSLVYSGVIWGLSFVRGDSVAGLPILHQVAGFGLAAVVALRLLRLFKWLDRRLFTHYLMHDYAYSAAHRGAYPPELEERLTTFADRIAEALASEADEVLIVGHSSGAHLGVSLLADLIRAGHVSEDGPALGFLSLGHVIPMVSFLPEARRLRRDLHFLASCEALTWIDVTAPGDGCCFALCDPVDVSGVAPAEKRWPLVFSAAFTQSLAPETWAGIKRRFFRVHFQYLCAFDRPKDYDYFQITAGPLTLADRYEGRPASRSRIDVPVNKHTSVAA